MVKLGGEIRMCRKPSQRRGKVVGAGNNSYRGKINPVMSLIKKAKRAVAKAMKKEAIKSWRRYGMTEMSYSVE